MEETGAGVLLAFSDNSSAQERGEKGGCRRSDLTAGRDSRWLLVVSDAARKREEEEDGGGCEEARVRALDGVAAKETSGRRSPHTPV